MNFVLDGYLADECSASAVILSGGLNTRMHGRNKAFLKIGDITILERLITVLQMRFADVILVTREPDLYVEQPVRVVTDFFKDRSSLTGIHAGLVNAVSPYAFIIPCDTPFLKPELVNLLLSEIEPQIDVIVPFYGGHYQPLCAIYSRRCIPVFESQIRQKKYKILDAFIRMNVKTVPIEKLQTADPEMSSFLNVNTPEAYDICRNLMAKISKVKE